MDAEDNVYIADAAISSDPDSVWNAHSTTNRDRKRLLRCLIEEVQLRTEKGHYTLQVGWKGGAKTRAPKGHGGAAGWARRTPEDTLERCEGGARVVHQA